MPNHIARATTIAVSMAWYRVAAALSAFSSWTLSRGLMIGKNRCRGEDAPIGNQGTLGGSGGDILQATTGISGRRLLPWVASGSIPALVFFRLPIRYPSSAPHWFSTTVLPHDCITVTTSLRWPSTRRARPPNREGSAATTIFKLAREARWHKLDSIRVTASSP